MFDPCSIIYVSSGAGNFLAQILTAHADKQRMAQILDTQNNNEYDGKWTTKEEIFKLHSSIDLGVSSNVTKFEHLHTKNNIIFISAQTDEDKKVLEWRQTFLDNNMAIPEIFKIRYQYHYEMKNYLDKSGIKYYDIPLKCFLNQSLFLQKVTGLANYINCDIDIDLTKTMHYKWIKQNVKEFERKKNNGN